MKTISIRAAECRAPLPKPIKLGPVTIATRDFVALRISTDEGSVGDALGYTRGTALLQSLQHIGKSFLGVSPHARKSLVERFLMSVVNGRATYSRAISLLEIALTDLAAKSAALPLFRLLGGDRLRIPVSIVAGYYLNERTHEDVRDEVAQRIDEGFPRVKIMIGGSDAAADHALVSLASSVAGGRLAVDAHWSWSTVPEAFTTCRGLDDLGLLFIEDPFAPHRWRLVDRLQKMLRTPLACGEDMPDVETLHALSQTTPILRVDATTCGGVAAAIAATQSASLHGCEVFPHVHHHVHAQLAGACREIEYVEVIPQRTGADPAHLLLQRNPVIKDGFLHVDEEPGAGIALDWDAVEKYAVAAFTLNLDDR